MIPTDRERLELGALAVIVAIGAALRFAGLGSQGYWYDEAHTALLVQLTPGEMLSQLALKESTPPFYYCAAWVWGHLFGYTESALRSLSALVGTLTIPVLYLIGRRLAGGRAGLIAAALGACNPLFVWYSQEARAYAPVTFLSAVGFLLFLYARERPRPAILAGWAAFSVMAMATHYLAGLVVASEAALLLFWNWRRALGWVAFAGAAAAGLLPLASAQAGTRTAHWIARLPYDVRLEQFGRQSLAGFGASTAERILVAAGLAVALVLLVLRASHAERASAFVAAGVGIGALAIGIALVAAGADELITRNVIVIFVPLIGAVAVALGSQRAGLVGLAAAALIGAAWVGVNLSVASDAHLQRPDWRLVLEALGPARHRRLIVTEHYRSSLPIGLYDRSLQRVAKSAVVTVWEIDVVAAHGGHGRACWWGSSCNLSRARITHKSLPGLRQVRRWTIPNFKLARFQANHPVRVKLRQLQRELAHVGLGAIFIQPR